MKKRTFYTEVSYIVGLISLSLATALTETAGFGVSMVVAPAYLLHLKFVSAFPFFRSELQNTHSRQLCCC